MYFVLNKTELVEAEGIEPTTFGLKVGIRA